MRRIQTDKKSDKLGIPVNLLEHDPGGIVLGALLVSSMTQGSQSLVSEEESGLDCEDWAVGGALDLGTHLVSRVCYQILTNLHEVKTGGSAIELTSTIEAPHSIVQVMYGHY